jgi:hypothetical protein
MLFITSRRKTIFLVLVLWEIVRRLASAMPSLLLDSGRAKCVTVAAPKDTRLKIEYEAPGKGFEDMLRMKEKCVQEEFMC